MESPVRKMQKKNDYNRHKLLRKIKRRRKAAAEQQSHAAEKELRRKLKMPKFDMGLDARIDPPKKRPMMKPRPINRDDDPDAFDESKELELYIKQHSDLSKKDSEQAFIEKKQREAAKARSMFNQARSASNMAMNTTPQIETAKAFVDNVKQYSEDLRLKKLDKVHELKLMADALATATELSMSGASLLKAYANYNKWANSANMTKRGIINLLNQEQFKFQTAGTLADAYQFMTADNNYDFYKNGIESLAGGAGMIGASDWFRTSSYFPRYGKHTDALMDAIGVAQATWDLLGEPVYKLIQPLWNKNK